MRNACSGLGSDIFSGLDHSPILRYLQLAGKYAVPVDILSSVVGLEYAAPKHADQLLNKNPISANFDFSSAYFVAIYAGLLVLLVAAAYWPGLGGPFVLDDFGSIAALGNRGGVVDWETFRAFVLGGTSGPTGRPVSLLTFLIDANNWPADAWPFKRTNLIVHCLNGALLGVLIQQILALLRYERRDVRCIAIAAAGIWLLHPFLVSTTLYVVQRMAQLSTLFCFAGLILYLRGRVLLPSNARRAYILMSVAIGVFGIVAMLAKENGILLPLLAGTIEVTVVASQREHLGKLNRYWCIAFFLVPALVIAVYLGARIFSGSFFEVVPPRDFSLYERLLTQPRILFDYLQNWFLPKLYTTGVFQDHFIKSSGLIAPLTTLLSILAHTCIIALAIIKRHSWPIFALAALFFYCGHLLESTVMNLELYFEHRNYLASAFLFLPLLVALRRKVELRQFALLSLITCLLLAGFTRYSSGVWASWPGMVEASARKAPTSARAQAQYSVLLFNAGRHDESIEVLDRAIEIIPVSNPLLIANRLVTLCELNRLVAEEFDTQALLLSKTAYDARLLTLYTSLAVAVVAGKCPSVNTTQLIELFTTMLSVPVIVDKETLEYSQVQYLIGFSYVQDGQPQKAITAFTESLGARSGAGHAMQMAAVLASANYGVEALHFSDLALADLAVQPASVLNAASVSEADIRGFQETVRADIKALQDADMPRAEP